jgi:hypothetical protein
MGSSMQSLMSNPSGMQSQLAPLTEMARRAMIDQAHGVSAPSPFGAASGAGSASADAFSVSAEDLVAPYPEPQSCLAPDYECQVPPRAHAEACELSMCKGELMDATALCAHSLLVR